MIGSLLQLYHNTNITLKSNVSDITFFRIVYLKYFNFSIDTITNKSTFTCKFGETNEININNHGSFINNITLKFEISSLQSTYILDKINYKNNLLYSNNLNQYYNFYFSTNEKFKLNLINQILNNNKLFNYIFSNNNIIYKLDLNKFINTTQYNNDIEIDIDQIYTNNIINIYNNIPEISSDSITNNYIVNIYNYKYKFNNKNLLSLYDKISSILYDYEINIIHSSYNKLLIDNYYTNINTATSVLSGYINYLYNLIHMPIADQYNFINNKYLALNFINKNNLIYNTDYNFNINNDISIIKVNNNNNNNTNDKYLISNNNNNFIFSNVEKTNNKLITLSKFKNNNILDTTNSILIIKNHKINNNAYSIELINTFTKQYKIKISTNYLDYNEPNIIDYNYVNKYIYIFNIVEEQIETIYYINNIIFLNNSYCLYCTLYDNEQQNIINTSYSFFNVDLNNLIDINDIFNSENNENSENSENNEIVNIEYYVSDSIKTIEYILKYNSIYLKNLNNMNFKQILINSVDITNKYNILFFKNILMQFTMATDTATDTATNTAIDSAFNFMYELYEPVLSPIDSANIVYNNDEYIILDDVIEIGTSPTDFIENSKDCFIMSIAEAKELCNSLNNNFNAFYALNKNGKSMVCFKTYHNLNNINNLDIVINKNITPDNINSAFFIKKIKKVYDVNLQVINSDSYIITDNILIEYSNKLKLLRNTTELMIDAHYYQEEKLPFNILQYQYTINSKFPTKFLSFVIQPSGLLLGKTYLSIPGNNYFENASKRFCFKYAKSILGILLNNNSLVEENLSNNYSQFFIDLNNNILNIGEKLIFNDHDTYNINYTIFLNLFTKLSPILISKSVNLINNIPYYNTNNIKVNINNLNKQDKYLLSLNCVDLENLYRGTTDVYNEGFKKYDLNIYDYSTFTTQLDRKEDNILENVSLTLNNVPKMDYFDINLFTNLENYKYDLAIKNGINFYSFSIYPKNYNPSGTCNFSNVDKYDFKFKIKEINDDIDNKIFNLKDQLIKKNSKIIFFSKYYNILSINNGL